MQTAGAAAGQPIELSHEVEEALYEVRQKIHPRAVHGWFAGWRWALVWFTQILFYGGAWLTWNGRQAVLFDLAARKFYIFGLVLWPQDFIFLAVLLIISAYALFLFTAVAGRLFCGYACPQTVYTEIFMWIERKVEGERNARIKLDRSALGWPKLSRKALKHALWIALALWTGFTFVGYFTPVRQLAYEVAAWALGPWQLFWIGFYTFATYGNAGWMREQVCKYMCPYARFQSAMLDRDSLIITYDTARGEARGSRPRRADPRALGLGDCVDCGICVEVCPTGIDIRKGLQYECIGCAACIDGCNQVMDKMGYAAGLIRYSTDNALTHQWSRADTWRRVWRPRTLIYSAILLAIVTAFVTALALRVPLKVDVIRDRGALARVVEDGVIENVYRLQIMNTQEEFRRYRISVSGIEGISIASEQIAEVPGAAAIMFPLRVQVPPARGTGGTSGTSGTGGTGGTSGTSGTSSTSSSGTSGAPGSNKIAFDIRAINHAAEAVREKSVFLIPRSP